MSACRFRYDILLAFIFLLLCWPSFSVAASTATLHKFAGYEMGYGTYRFEEKLDHKIVFPVANITAGLAYKRFSYVLNLSGSLTEADVSEEEQIGSGSRQDIDLTVGYQFNKKVSLFIGYKDGVSRINFKSRVTSIYGTGNERYEQDGFFSGVNFNWAYKNAGKLSVSVAYAKFNARNQFLQDEPFVIGGADEFEFDDVTGNSSGTTSGFSYTLAYTLPIKGNLLFKTRLRLNRYEQDISGEQAATGGTVSYKFNDIAESSTMLLVGVTAVF